MKTETKKIKDLIFNWAETESKVHTCHGLSRLCSSSVDNVLLLLCARGGYHGLWIELKTATGKPSKEQKEMVAFLNEEGYYAVVCYGYIETISVLKDYVTGRIVKKPVILRGKR